MLELDQASGLPVPEGLRTLLGSVLGMQVGPYVDQALIAAANELVSRPSKRFRARLVELSYALCRDARVSPEAGRQLGLCAQAVELLHAGSLIVDDVQDGSQTRRGAAAIHAIYGVPSAICTGNWLYFWPMRLLRDLQLPAATEHRAFAIYHDALEKAHYGQALDLKLRADTLPREQLADLALAVTDLKTGSITSLAMELGALIAGADDVTTAAIARFGRLFGVALQQLDDLGNVHSNDAPEKRCEDLLQGKVTAVWGYAARLSSDDEFDSLVAAVASLRSGEGEALESWLAETNFIAQASAVIRCDLDAAFAELMDVAQIKPDHPALHELRRLAESLLHAYV